MPRQCVTGGGPVDVGGETSASALPSTRMSQVADVPYPPRLLFHCRGRSTVRLSSGKEGNMSGSRGALRRTPWV